MSIIQVVSPLNAIVWQIEVAIGQQVARDELLLVLESMKTEIPVEAPAAGVVREIRVQQGSPALESQVLLVIET